MLNPDSKTYVTDSVEADSDSASSSASNREYNSAYRTCSDRYQSDHAMHHHRDDASSVDSIDTNVRSTEKIDLLDSDSPVIGRSDEKNDPVYSETPATTRSDEKNDQVDNETPTTPMSDPIDSETPATTRSDEKNDSVDNETPPTPRSHEMSNPIDSAIHVTTGSDEITQLIDNDIPVTTRSDEMNDSIDSEIPVTARSDELNEPIDREIPAIPFELTDSWKLCILAQAFNSCLPSFIQNLTSVLPLADCLYSKRVFSNDDIDHVGAVLTTKGRTSGCRELLHRVKRNSCYAWFLHSLQIETVSEKHLHMELSEAITRHICAISKILEENIDVSEELLRTLRFFEAITADAKHDILSQERHMRAARLLDYLSPEGKYTPAFEKCISIVCHAPAFVDAKRAMHDYLLAERLPGEQLEGVRLTSVHGDRSTWASWGDCLRTSAEGQRKRPRTYTNPPPTNGGRECVDHSQVIDHCDNAACPPVLRHTRVIIGGGRGRDVDQFSHPRGVAVSPAGGRLYVADAYNHRVKIYNADGAFINTFGTEGQRDGQFYYPTGLVVNSHEEIVITDSYNHRIVVCDRAGQFKYTFGEHGSNKEQFEYPWGVAVDMSDNMYICDAHNNRVQVFTRTGEFIRQIGRAGSPPGELSTPRYVSVAMTTGHVYVTSSHRVSVFTAEGLFIFTFRSCGEANGEMTYPRGIAIDEHGFVILSDRDNHRVQVFSADGRAISTFGSKGVKNGQFDHPEGLAITQNGDVIVVDTENNRVQIVSYR